ncbi:MAG: Rossmann-like domain-containing protein [Myxococcales bacterium]
MNPTLIAQLLDTLTDDAPVRDVFVGAHMAAVCSRRCGLAATFQPEGDFEHVPVRQAGRLSKMSARELAEYARSEHPLEAAIGVAALNSLLPLPPRRAELNASGLLVERGRGKQVVMIGHFPFVPKLRQAAKQLWIVEKRPREDDLPAETAASLLAEADVVGITGSALVNHTLESLLAMCRKDAFVMVLGPTTPLSPLLFERGVSVLCGTEVVDEPLLLAGLTQAAHFRAFEGVRMIACTAADMVPGA